MTGGAWTAWWTGFTTISPTSCAQNTPRASPMSRRLLSVAFSGAGKTFTRYVNDVRCSEACVRLSQSERPIAVIAGECGFTSIAHFDRQFLARMKNSTPREYRRNTASRPQTGAGTR